MAWRIVKQPNGKLARYSDIVDNFTHYNLSVEEALYVCRLEMGVVEANEKVQRGLDDIEPWKTTKGDGLSRWRDCLQSIEAVHGIKEREKIISLINEEPL